MVVGLKFELRALLLQDHTSSPFCSSGASWVVQVVENLPCTLEAKLKTQYHQKKKKKNVSFAILLWLFWR
jgi:hypothetical protein